MKNTSIRKVQSTCESVEVHTSPSLFQRSRDGDEYQPSAWSCPIGWLLLPIRLLQGCPSISNCDGQNAKGLRSFDGSSCAEQNNTAAFLRGKVTC